MTFALEDKIDAVMLKLQNRISEIKDEEPTDSLHHDSEAFGKLRDDFETALAEFQESASEWY